MTTRLIALILASAVTACSAKHDTPAVKDDPLPYRSVSATEVFHLRNECAKLGDQILEGAVVGVALTKEVATHYNSKTNRCYAQVTVQPRDTTGTDMSTYIYDGQTKEMLAYDTSKAGKKSYMNLAQLPTGDAPDAHVEAEQLVQDAINLAMNDDRKS